MTFRQFEKGVAGMNKLFEHSLRTATAQHAEAVRKYELYRTVVEFLAALMFLIGSVFFSSMTA
ncbi:hypothetical protein QW131_08465 [Roseibium salinum]|nr:hypothetical protein [Roseibium salinum]